MTGSDGGANSGVDLDWFADLRSREAERRARHTGRFYGESPGVVARLIDAGVTLESLLVLERRAHLLDDLDVGDAAVAVLSDPELRDVVGFDMHRGMIGSFVRPRPLTADELVDRDIVCVVEAVGDDANIGAIVRTAAALGADALVLDESAADPFTRRAVRVSMGSIGRIPTVRSTVWPPEMAGRTTIALTPSGDVEIGDVDVSGPVAVVVGAEGPGLSRAMLDAADVRARIDMGPGVDSLSVSHATAVGLYQVRRALSPKRRSP